MGMLEHGLVCNRHEDCRKIHNMGRECFSKSRYHIKAHGINNYSSYDTSGGFIIIPSIKNHVALRSTNQHSNIVIYQANNLIFLLSSYFIRTGLDALTMRNREYILFQAYDLFGNFTNYDIPDLPSLKLFDPFITDNSNTNYAPSVLTIMRRKHNL